MVQPSVVSEISSLSGMLIYIFFIKVKNYVMIVTILLSNLQILSPKDENNVIPKGLPFKKYNAAYYTKILHKVLDQNLK